MQTLKIKATIDVANPQQMLAASNFIAAMNGTVTPVLTGTIETAISTSEVAPAPAPKEEKPKRARRTKEQIEADKVAADAAKGKKKIEKSEEIPAAAAPATKTEGDLSLEDVREVMASKMPTHKDAIKGKFKELGATKMSTLKEEHYQTFVDFLNTL